MPLAASRITAAGGLVIVRLPTNTFPQYSQPFAVFRFVDVAAGESSRQQLFGRRRIVARLVSELRAARAESDQDDDTDDDQRPEQHHPDAHPGVTPPTHIVVVPKHHDGSPLWWRTARIL